ncbi:MAG: radical SAM protein [Myxococcales bacterium]|jgi:23S rRNA (adenine2503-C2)-methyltransferase|nr:radical SAM protein [Myxococcales bacterium]
MLERPLNDLDFDELVHFVETLGGSGPQARRIFSALYRPGRDPSLGLLGRLDEVSPRLVSQIERAPWGSLRVLDRRRASDGFVKYLFESPLGGRFETVRIPLFDEKHVVCVSSQVGCALGCDFCATGRLGFSRHLETWEMVEQVRVLRDEAPLPVRHVVFMGMGEPFLNEKRVLRAAHLFTRSGGLQIAGRNITISTAGIVPAIRRYAAADHPFRLTFSLTSAIPQKRLRLMPIEKRYPLPELIDAIREFTRLRRERAVVAYVAIRGLNTGPEDVEALRAAFEGIPIKLDLIDVSDSTGRYQPPDEAELRRFRDMLQTLRVPIGRRYSGGKEIGAACGNLAATCQGGEPID